jgi:uncharacterized membrane protein YjgN (DUF898 family)
MIHAHLTSMLLAIILFIVVVILQGKGKNTKVWQMILRTSYILIIVTGLMIFFGLYDITFMYILKAVMGVVMIGVFEMIISWKSNGKPTGLLWIAFAVALVAVILLGMMLPLGMKYL